MPSCWHLKRRAAVQRHDHNEEPDGHHRRRRRLRHLRHGDRCQHRLADGLFQVLILPYGWVGINLGLVRFPFDTNHVEFKLSAFTFHDYKVQLAQNWPSSHFGHNYKTANDISIQFKYYLSTTRFFFWPTAVPAPTPRRTRQKSEITRLPPLTWGQPQPPPLSHLHTSMIFLCLDVCSWPRILILMLPILTRDDEQRVGSWEEAGKFYSVPGIRITLTTRQDLSRHCIDMCWAFANTPTWFTGF